MSPLQITLIIVVVIILVTASITYLIRQKYYKQIDELDQQKNNVLKKAPYKELKEVGRLNISGQSYEMREKLEKQWQEIESVKYPKLENNLFDAEQATDRYRLGESKKNKDAAEQAISEISQEITTLKESLTELIEREQANLVQIDEIKKKYHEIRKSLLAYSFSFGPASESLEKKLRSMEDEFSKFSNLTVSGDHEEANAVVERLGHTIAETEAQMDEVPPLLDVIDEDYIAQIDDLENGYHQMSDAGFLFPNDTILEDIKKLREDKTKILEYIRLLELEKAHEFTEKLSKDINALYDRMEEEYKAKPEVAEVLENSKRALYFLQDENRRLNAIEKRMIQSYILNHDEVAKINHLGEQVKEARENYDFIEERVKHEAIPFSIAYDKLMELFDQLDHLNSEYYKLAKGFEDYREQELSYRNDLYKMEEQMYSMKRRLENERLPGLPEDYLELFFSTTKRVEQLASELSRPRIQLVDIQKTHRNCVEDVDQLEDMTNEMIDQVELTERTSQRLYRYKDTHKGILETIRYSQSLFSDDYDYETSLRMVREKLENIAPGEYLKVLEAYEAEKG